MTNDLKGAASPADVLDRTLFLVGAQPKDSDEDLSEDEQDRMSDEVRDDQRDLKSSKKDKEDEDDKRDDLDDIDDDEKAEQDQDKDERDADLDEEEETYRKRFADTKADRDEKVRQLRELMTENAKLKAMQTATSDVDEEALAREIQEGIFKDVSQITEPDPVKARKAAYDVVGKHIALSTKKAVELALKKVQSAQQEQQTQTQQQQQQLEVAKRRAKIALKEVGLDGEKHYQRFEDEVTKQMESDPEWFETIPPAEHYLRIANRVKRRLEQIREKNSEHQREAGGQLNGGARIAKRTTKAQDGEGDEQEPDTMTGAMRLLGQRNLSRGNRAFQLAHLHRR